jgi:hypothetical protein
MTPYHFVCLKVNRWLGFRQDRVISMKGGKAMTFSTIREKLTELRSRQRIHATRRWVRNHLARLPEHLADDVGLLCPNEQPPRPERAACAFSAASLTGARILQLER